MGRRLLISLLSLTLALIAVEVYYRWTTFGAAGFSPTRVASVRTFGRAGLCRAAERHDLRYELKPDLDTYFLLHPFRTNSHGMRDREYSLEKPAHVFRIAFVGDSYTMGHGVPIEDVYHTLLEDSLNARPAGRPFECLNFGVAGYHLLQYALVVEQKALAFEPDLIVLGLVANDLPPPSMRYFEAGPYTDVPAAPPAPFLRPTFLEPTLFALRRPRGEVDEERARVFLARRLEHARAAAVVPGMEHEPDAGYAELVFRRIGHSAAGTRTFCVYLARNGSKGSRATAARFRTLAGQVGFGFCDTSPALAGVDPADLAVLRTDAHPNSEAHALYARELERALDDGGWVPAP